MIRFERHLTLPYGSGETWISYASRMAQDRRIDLWQLCSMMGLSYFDVVNCDPQARAIMEDTFTGIDGAALVANAVERVSQRHYRLRHAVFPREALNRTELRVCPECVREQIASGQGRLYARPQCATAWLLASNRTCAHHELELVPLSRTIKIREVHDFAFRMKRFVGDIDALLAHATRSSPSSLEKYLLERVDGIAGPVWLDQMDFHAANKTCEVLGVVETHGIWAAWNDLTPSQWQAAGQVGYDIAKEGGAAIDEWLKGLTRAFLASRRAWGLKSVYGRLYEWLSHDSKDPGFDPLRKVMHDHIVSNLPIGPKDKIFRWPVERRRVHSAYTLHLETRLPITGIRRLGHAMGLLEDDRALTDDRILMQVGNAVGLIDGMRSKIAQAASTPKRRPRTAFMDLVHRLQLGLSLAEVTRCLSLPRDIDRMLLREGWIIPLYTPDEVSQYLFERKDIETFYRTMKKMVTTDDLRGLVALAPAKKRAKCTEAELFRLLMSGRLKRIGWDTRKDGYAALLVDPKEAAAQVRGTELTGLTLRMVEKRLHTSSRVVNDLIAAGHLPSRKEMNPINRCPQTTVQERDLEIFVSSYASVYALSVELDFGARGIKTALDRRGIQPVFDRATIRAGFYRRDQIPPDLLK